MPGESKTSPRRLKAYERQRQALELRAAGHTFDEIAERLGYRGKSSAYRAVESALRKTIQQPADDVRMLNLERLNSMLVAVWPKVVEGNYMAIDRALKILERQAKLLGLDTPEEPPVMKLIIEVEHVTDWRQAGKIAVAEATPGATDSPQLPSTVQVDKRGEAVEEDHNGDGASSD